MSVLWVLIRKEWLQFRRNKFLPRLVMAMPVIYMLVLPLVTTMDVRHIGTTVVDNDHSPLSRTVVDHMQASAYFQWQPDVSDYATAMARLDQGLLDVVVAIPEGFERDLLQGHPHPMQVVANGVNATKGTQGMQYAVQTIAQCMQPAPPAEVVAIQQRYNPTANYRHFMIPALMIMLLLVLCGFLPALNIVGEKEAGTIEQMNVTPVTRLQFTLAKLIPYWVISLLVFVAAMLMARWVYGLEPQGSVAAILLGAVLFSMAMSGFGVAVANISDNMQQTIFVMFFFVMIFMLMSGLFTPVESMPRWAQVLSCAFPPRYFIHIMRAVYLKGTTFGELWLHFAALGAGALLFALVAMLTYRKQN